MAPRGRTYLIAWAALVALTGTSYLASRCELGAWSLTVALGIAAIKVGIVLAAFMHVLSEATSVRFVAVLNAVWVLLLCLGIVADVAAR